MAPSRMVSSPTTTFSARWWVIRAAPRLPIRAPVATKTAAKPAMNRLVPSSIRPRLPVPCITSEALSPVAKLR